MILLLRRTNTVGPNAMLMMPTYLAMYMDNDDYGNRCYKVSLVDAEKHKPYATHQYSHLAGADLSFKERLASLGAEEIEVPPPELSIAQRVKVLEDRLDAIEQAKGGPCARSECKGLGDYTCIKCHYKYCEKCVSNHDCIVYK